jgi:hypothetical protein
VILKRAIAIMKKIVIALKIYLFIKDEKYYLTSFINQGIP